MEIIVNTKFIQRSSCEVGNFPAVSACNNNVKPVCYYTDTSMSCEALVSDSLRIGDKLSRFGYTRLYAKYENQ